MTWDAHPKTRGVGIVTPSNRPDKQRTGQGVYKTQQGTGKTEHGTGKAVRKFEPTASSIAQRIVPRVLAVVGAGLALSLLAPSLTAQTDHLTGADFKTRLESETQINWQGTPLRDALRGLEETQRISIFLDRRVDPNQKVIFKSGEGSLEEHLTSLADDLKLDVSTIDSVVYIGPPNAADRVASMTAFLRLQLKEADRSIRGKWLARSSRDWQVLTVPQQLVQEVAGDAGLAIEGLDRIPHDLWVDQSWPSLPLLDQCCLLLAGFDLTIAVSPSNFQGAIVDLPERITFEKVHRLPRNATLDVDTLKDRIPGIEAKLEGTRLVVVGSARDQDMITDLLAGRRVRTPRNQATEKRYTIRDTTTEAGNVVATVASQLDLAIQYEGNAAEKLAQRITVNVRDVTLDELMRETLAPLGLTYRINDEAITILPR